MYIVSLLHKPSGMMFNKAFDSITKAFEELDRLNKLIEGQEDVFEAKFFIEKKIPSKPEFIKEPWVKRYFVVLFDHGIPKEYWFFNNLEDATKFLLTISDHITKYNLFPDYSVDLYECNTCPCDA